jgi:hypothetical protein
MQSKRYENLYAERDVVKQGAHYLKHINAMTKEDLHSKSDIAAELAHRDIRIKLLESKVSDLCYRLDHAFGAAS